ncbi:hypothetical protein CC77DRAFT_248574 [Alternaria alternata]|uniref:Uncharacterized protein n=1 Tax=Alternaria alternata TaxID=5599 RepID=A0A177DDW1_ALTAL|nr:hypothetical protein CC77DRAFT_248574 [Alternaria alternata]OAG18024.1 hypothetical protein CC77DRAFT_248574 [Alternaria alternata]
MGRLSTFGCTGGCSCKFTFATACRWSRCQHFAASSSLRRATQHSRVYPTVIIFGRLTLHSRTQFASRTGTFLYSGNSLLIPHPNTPRRPGKTLSLRAPEYLHTVSTCLYQEKKPAAQQRQMNRLLAFREPTKWIYHRGYVTSRRCISRICYKRQFVLSQIDCPSMFATTYDFNLCQVDGKVEEEMSGIET